MYAEALNPATKDGVTWGLKKYRQSSISIKLLELNALFHLPHYQLVGGTRNKVNLSGMTFIDPDEHRFFISGTAINVHPLLGWTKRPWTLDAQAQARQEATLPNRGWEGLPLSVAHEWVGGLLMRLHENDFYHLLQGQVFCTAPQTALTLKRNVEE